MEANQTTQLKGEKQDSCLPWRASGDIDLSDVARKPNRLLMRIRMETIRRDRKSERRIIRGMRRGTGPSEPRGQPEWTPLPNAIE